MPFRILALLLSVILPFGHLDLVQGTAINITEAPWQASVLVNDKHRCGGVIYSKDVVLTIAQCVKGVRTGNLAVRVGSDKKDLGGQVLPANRVVTQALGLLPSDVVIIALEKSIDLDDNAKSIDLASRLPKLDTEASVTGWTEVVGEDPAEEFLMRTNVTVVENLECRSDGFFIKRILRPNELCASKSNSTNVACQGFSGSPLVSDGKLIGIASWNVKCDFLQSPSVYADIAVIKPWISSTAKLLNVF
ncbi:trypsin alpha [Drosophila kikkawai]|uniref:trypsin n=1 Tax=Drosophila kikkawai TaxID=30033 RepID=A0A6P4HZV5_DROKI|nr:trypsin alpha [Drosophila kikkawai]